MPGSGTKPPLPGTIIIFGVLAVIIAVAARRSGALSEATLIYFIVLIPSVILHEISHGYLAHLFGDDTAKRAGRLTLNPLRHVDLLGTFIIPGVLLLSGTGLAFGYAKPVPVNDYGMSKNRAMFVGLVGPATNVVLAIIAAGVMHLVFGDSLSKEAFLFVYYFGIVNVVLATFNMIPIPPLDGSSVIERFLPEKYMLQYHQFRKYSMFVLLALVLVGGNLLGRVFDPAIDLWQNLLPFDPA